MAKNEKTTYTGGQTPRAIPMGALRGQTPVCSLEDWLDGLTVEDMLGISRRTLQYYRSSGLFPYLKIGNKIYYKRADIEAFMEAEYSRQQTAIGRDGEKARRRAGEEGGGR